jgi:hypothetical protein
MMARAVVSEKAAGGLLHRRDGKMRRPHPIPLLACLACLLVFAVGARAGVTIDVVFQDPYSADDPAGPGCVFTGYYGTTVSTGYCMDVIIRSTIELVNLSVSVEYEGDNGLELASMYEWTGVTLGPYFKCGGLIMCGVPTNFCTPASGLEDQGEIIQSFDCVVHPESHPTLFGAGTYRIGTVIWDTSGLTPGIASIAAYIDDLADGFSTVINGNVVDISSEVVLNSASLQKATPVPSISVWGYAVLFSGVMGIGLVLAARRRRPPRR